MTPRRATLRPFLALALTMALAGCGKDDDNPVVPQPDAGLPPNTPEATTPTNLLARFEATYEYEHKEEFGKLLTANYRFAFSSQSDPDLASTYGDTWDRSMELTSFGHLMMGFTDEEGTYRAAASSISWTFEGTSVIDDPDHADSTAFYKIAIVPRIRTHISLTDGTEFLIDAPHDLYLVRGDAAVLASGQQAGADRWYIRRWNDKSPPLAALLLPARPFSMGRIKATYLR